MAPVSAIWLSLPLVLIGTTAVAETAPNTIRVPDGFTVELVAGAPLVSHPVMAGFDDRGRLFVADNAGLNLPAEELEAKLPNMVRMLEDTNGDGRFDRSTVFADRMTFPQGAAWYRGALYVASPPSIWKLEDTNDDGIADKRQELVGKFGYVGNAADVHGCFITPTGRIAWCDGRHGHTFEAAEGRPTSKGLAARVFSCRTDGNDVEVFCGGGMDNPVEVAFTAEGDTIGTMTFYNPDDARHDALVHFVYGGVYPKKHPCTSEFKRTGELMPALSRFGVTAPSGLACFVGATWGPEFEGNLYSAQFNTHKVLRHILRREGASYACTDEEFLSSTNADFHPTDVLQDADGSLLVVDTGGWFRIGCPTSQIAKPEIGGAIYRIRRTGAAPVVDPRGLAMDWDRISDTEMADLLGDSRPAVAERATEILALRGDAAMGSLATALFENESISGRQNAVWALARNGSDNARMLLRQVLSDDDPAVRRAAVHAASDLRDADSLPILLNLVATDEAAVKREAATALGRLRKPAAVPALLAALEQPADRFLDHALIFALIEINDPAATRKGLSHASSAVRRGALVALDQMENGGLDGETLKSLLPNADATLRGAIVGVLASHPAWADNIAGVLGTWLALPAPSAEELAAAAGAVGALGDRASVQSLVAESLARESTARAVRLMLLEVLAEGRFESAPAVYEAALRSCLAADDAEVARQAIRTVAAIDPQPHQERLLEIGLDARREESSRLAALRAASRSGPALPNAGVEFLAGLLEKQSAAGDRLAAADALGGVKLTDEQKTRLLRLLPTCGPLEVAALLTPFEGGTDERLGSALVSALAASRGTASISPERLQRVFAKYPAAVQKGAAALIAHNRTSDTERAARLSSLESAAQPGDAARGEDVFFSQRAACSACHRVETRGERIGPDLSKIGEVRTRRDLLEAILFPSTSLARGYESYQVATKEGKVHSGLLARETAGAIFLRTTERAEIRVSRDEVEEMSPSTTSIMPQGLEKTLSPAELADLVAYLGSLK